MLVRTVPLYQHKSLRRAREDQLVSEVPAGADRSDWLQHVEIQVDHRDPRAARQENLSPAWSGPAGDDFSAGSGPERGHTVPMSATALSGLAEAAGEDVVQADSSGRTAVYAVRVDLMPGREQGSMELMPRSAGPSQFGVDAGSWYRQQEAMVAARNEQHPARTEAGRTRRRLPIPTDPETVGRIGRETTRSASLGASIGRSVPRVGPVVGGAVGAGVGMLRAVARERPAGPPEPPPPSDVVPTGRGGGVARGEAGGGVEGPRRSDPPARGVSVPVMGPGGGDGRPQGGDLISRMDQALVAGRGGVGRDEGLGKASAQKPIQLDSGDPEPELG